MTSEIGSKVFVPGGPEASVARPMADDRQHQRTGHQHAGGTRTGVPGRAGLAAARAPKFMP